MYCAHAYACMYNKEHPIGGPVPGLRPCRLPPSRPPLPIPPSSASLRPPLPTLPSGLRPRCSAAIRPPPPSSAPFTAHAVPPSSSAVLLRPLPSSSAGRCPLRCPARRLLLLSSALRRTAIPNSSLLLPDFNLQSMLCSIIPKDFRKKIWRVGVKCRSLQSAP